MSVELVLKIVLVVVSGLASILSVFKNDWSSRTRRFIYMTMGLVILAAFGLQYYETARTQEDATLREIESQYAQAKALDEQLIRIEKQVAEQRRVAEETLQLQTDLAERFASNPSVALVNRIGALQNDVKKVSDANDSLKQALNPTNPEDIIRVLRLGDKVSELTSRLDESHKDMEARYTAFTTQVTRELDGQRGSSNLVIIVLIPLTFNFLYNLWKDNRKKDEPSTAQK